MLRPFLACVPMLLACSASLADNCDAIRAQIDSKIRATGVAGFTLTIVEAGAPGAGKAVGTCAMGSRKIVYSAGPAASAVASSASTSARRSVKPTAARDIITECKDGSMSLGGECKE